MMLTALSVRAHDAAAPPAMGFAPISAASEARLDAQILHDIEPYYGELERGFAATHLPRIGTIAPAIGFSTLAKVAWAISDGDRVVGKAVCTVKRNGSWKVGPIAVLPEHRNHGHASAFLAVVVHRAHTGGWPCVFATVPRANAAALRIFERAGFHRRGALEGHYRTGEMEDVLVCTAPRPVPLCPLETEALDLPLSPAERIRQFVVEQFFPVDAAWQRWLAQHPERSLGDFADKPHEIVHGDRMGTALMIYKRGGTAKIVPVADSEFPLSDALVQACERAARRYDRHKAAMFLPAEVPGPAGYRRELVADRYSLRGAIAVWSRRIG